MKILCFVILAACLSSTAQGQVGDIHFGNTATTLITTNDFQGHIGNIVGVGTYRFGLYTAPFGTINPNLFTLLVVTTNVTAPGRFDGGSGPPVGLTPGQNVSFQVRGSWIEPGYAGQSTIGFFTVPAAGTIEIFGTGPGQVGGFQLTPVVPEPSTFALGLIGVLTLFAFNRRRLS